MTSGQERCPSRHSILLLRHRHVIAWKPKVQRAAVLAQRAAFPAQRSAFPAQRTAFQAKSTEFPSQISAQRTALQLLEMTPITTNHSMFMIKVS